MHVPKYVLDFLNELLNDVIAREVNLTSEDLAAIISALLILCNGYEKSRKTEKEKEKERERVSNEEISPFRLRSFSSQ